MLRKRACLGYINSCINFRYRILSRLEYNYTWSVESQQIFLACIPGNRTLHLSILNAERQIIQKHRYGNYSIIVNGIL
jgi:hypothetical protein